MVTVSCKQDRVHVCRCFFFELSFQWAIGSFEIFGQILFQNTFQNFLLLRLGRNDFGFIRDILLFPIPPRISQTFAPVSARVPDSRPGGPLVAFPNEHSPTVLGVSLLR